MYTHMINNNFFGIVGKGKIIHNQMNSETIT